MPRPRAAGSTSGTNGVRPVRVEARRKGTRLPLDRASRRRALRSRQAAPWPRSIESPAAPTAACFEWFSAPRQPIRVIPFPRARLGQPRGSEVGRRAGGGVPELHSCCSFFAYSALTRARGSTSLPQGPSGCGTDPTFGVPARRAHFARWSFSSRRCFPAVLHGRPRSCACTSSSEGKGGEGGCSSFPRRFAGFCGALPISRRCRFAAVRRFDFAAVLPISF